MCVCVCERACGGGLGGFGLAHLLLEHEIQRRPCCKHNEIQRVGQQFWLTLGAPEPQATVDIYSQPT